MSGPQRLRDLVNAWRPRTLPLDIDAATAAVAQVWADAVGRDVAARTRPAKLRDGALMVVTAGSAWSHQLAFLEPAIVGALRERLPGVRIDRLRFSIGAGFEGAQRARGRRHSAGVAPDAESQPGSAADLGELIAGLRAAQRRLDERRRQAGWRRCAGCDAWHDAAGKLCALCVEGAREEIRARVASALRDEPWLSDAAAAARVNGATRDDAYRVRARLADVAQRGMRAAQRRLRADDLRADDRLAAWTYAMLVTQRPQPALERAIVVSVLGSQWADALAPQAARNAEKKRASRTRAHAGDSHSSPARRSDAP